MNKEEYSKIVSNKRAQIRELQNQIIQLTKQYCEENSSFKKGDKIRLNGKEGVISSINIGTFKDFDYKWRPYKKDGHLSYERMLDWTEQDKIEKIK